MNADKLRQKANAVRDQLLHDYATVGREVSATVEEHSGTPTVKLRIVRPNKLISQKHFRCNGIVVDIVVTT